MERLAVGDLPPKPHLALRGLDGKLRHESCLTRDGFEGPYTIAYHEGRPQAMRVVGESIPREWPSSTTLTPGTRRRHFRTPRLAPQPAALGGQPLPLLGNADVVIGCRRFDAAQPVYHLAARHDELFFVLQGGGTLRTPLGDLAFSPGDYVYVPRGLAYRIVIDGSAPQHYLSLCFSGGVGIPSRFRNAAGQLRMDAPYCHRDFRRPEFRGPTDEGIREVWITTGPETRRHVCDHGPLDVVGWDGAVYPFAFPIRRFEPRVSSVHLPPTWHGTFEARGALICSFVPRPLDFHPQAVHCPYPHVSAEIDEVLFYVEGAFTSRVGVESGSLTWHPAGVPHGPHPGRYEASAPAAGENADPDGKAGEVRWTGELAVMLDCTSPLTTTAAAHAVEDAGYDDSFVDT